MKRFIDIGANLTDPMYNGIYHGSKKHDVDLLNVLERAWKNGLQKIIITGGSLDESKTALKLANTDDRLFSTVGCHPTRCQEFESENDPNTYLNQLEKLALDHRDKIVAIGECGLDYDRLEFCPKDIQKKYFQVQLELSAKLKVPLFLHCRNAAVDFIEIVDKFQGLSGVVHSFDGSASEVDSFVQRGFYIGINGCSLKTADNLSAIKSIPTDRLLLETDCPWCGIRPTHASAKYVTTTFPDVKKEKWTSTSLVKGRNEPCCITQVLEVIAHVRDEDPQELSETILCNTMKLFFPDK